MSATSTAASGPRGGRAIDVPGKIPERGRHPDLVILWAYSGRDIFGRKINLGPDTLGVSRHVITITPAKEGSSDLNVKRCRTSAFGTSSRNSPSTTSVLEEDLRVPVSPGVSNTSVSRTHRLREVRRLRRLLEPAGGSQLWTASLFVRARNTRSGRCSYLERRTVYLHRTLPSRDAPSLVLARLPQRKAGSTFPATR